MQRKALADIIFEKLKANKYGLSQQYNLSKADIGHFYIDDLLPEELAMKIYKAFPNSTEMVHKKSIREDKFVAAQMNNYDPILEEIIFAFQDERIVKLVGEICNIKSPFADKNLYAGGISMMGRDQFLNPHLDNSHDKDRARWRVLNLLYYVSPDWNLEYGANLELWPNGLKEKQITIHSRFNRLAVMATHGKSLHSVSPVKFDGFRCCVSNYYFSNEALKEDDTFHVTSFRARPEHKFTDMILQLDTWARMSIRKIFKKGIVENPHVYKKED